MIEMASPIDLILQAMSKSIEFAVIISIGIIALVLLFMLNIQMKALLKRQAEWRQQLMIMEIKKAVLSESEIEK